MYDKDKQIEELNIIINGLKTRNYNLELELRQYYTGPNANDVKLLRDSLQQYISVNKELTDKIKETVSENVTSDMWKI